MFRMYDFDGNGLISKDEFIRMLRWVVWDSQETCQGRDFQREEVEHEGGSGSTGGEGGLMTRGLYLLTHIAK